ncbi:MAG: hypothetical protein RBS19_05960 [Bacteroidales bacterium]|nr:hypothetical protein [Bacteroidales bacterium]
MFARAFSILLNDQNKKQAKYFFLKMTDSETSSEWPLKQVQGDGGDGSGSETTGTRDSDPETKQILTLKQVQGDG